MGGRVPAKRPAAKGASEVGQTSNDHQASHGFSTHSVPCTSACRGAADPV